MQTVSQVCTHTSVIHGSESPHGNSLNKTTNTNTKGQLQQASQSVMVDTSSTRTCCIAARGLDSPCFCSPKRTCLSTFRWRGIASRALAGSRDSSHTFLALVTSGGSIVTRKKAPTTQLAMQLNNIQILLCTVNQLILITGASVNLVLLL